MAPSIPPPVRRAAPRSVYARAMLRSLAPVALLALVACDPTLPAAPPHAHVAPQPRGQALELCWIEYATDSVPGSYGLAGGSDDVRWEITFSGLLVRHPEGHLLLDTGLSTHFAEERGTSRFIPGVLQKFVQGSGAVVASAPDALRRAGEQPSMLAAIVLSHIHGDHAGGVVDLPGTPVLLSPDEIAFIAREKEQGGFDVIRAHAEALSGRARPIRFTDTPYENFDRSADYFGDGSVVFVPLPGHTPGSIGTFINRSPAERYFHAGDASNTLEAVEKRRGKSVILQFTDHDGAAADATAARLNQLHAQDPALRIIPAHDRKTWRRAFGAPSACLRAPTP
jgi:glyoxylase-like metal-dependent hydrolase (beta-lactamase superfamily II)